MIKQMNNPQKKSFHEEGTWANIYRPQYPNIAAANIFSS